MPPQTSTVPGSMGRTVPASPNRIKAAHKVHNKVISRTSPRGQRKPHIFRQVTLPDSASGAGLHDNGVVLTFRLSKCEEAPSGRSSQRSIAHGPEDRVRGRHGAGRPVSGMVGLSSPRDPDS